METTFEVRVWTIREKLGSAKGGKPSKKSHVVRWKAGKRPFSKTYATRSLADSFRSKLITAQKKGEAFRLSDGMPTSFSRELDDRAWFEFAQVYVDMKWPRAAAKSRSSNADTMASVTMAMLATDRGVPPEKLLRKAMTGWAFNKKRRDDEKSPDVEKALRWLARNTLSVSRLDDPALIRKVLDRLAVKMDGKAAAANTVKRKRAVFFNSLEYAVESKLLGTNRIPEVKWKAPKDVKAIDKRVVVNPRQAKRLLEEVAALHVEGQPRRSAGPGLVACFGSMYYSALRPEEAAMLSKGDLQLPESGWGELLLSASAPIAGAAWTDSGNRRDRRQLKHRGEGEVRSVPCPPPLTALLHDHLEKFGTAADGRLFRSLTGGDIAESTIARVWNKARKAALTEQEYASVLGRRPYDLRHACVSTWLAAGVPSTQVAEWAGHSVTVLHQIYAKVIAGQEASALSRIGKALGLVEDVEPDHE
jgi:integrase